MFSSLPPGLVEIRVGLDHDTIVGREWYHGHAASLVIVRSTLRCWKFSPQSHRLSARTAGGMTPASPTILPLIPDFERVEHDLETNQYRPMTRPRRSGAKITAKLEKPRFSTRLLYDETSLVVTSLSSSGIILRLGHFLLITQRVKPFLFSLFSLVCSNSYGVHR